MKVRSILKLKDLKESLILFIQRLLLAGLDGGYWGAMGVRGAVRDKIKQQEHIDKEKTEFRKKVKRDFGDQNIKSPSITVENILTKISNNSKPKHPSGGKQESHSVVQSLLSEILQSLSTKECESDVISEKSPTIKKIDTAQHQQEVLEETEKKVGEKRIRPVPKLVRVEQSNVRIVTVKPVSTPEKRPASNDVESCPKRQKTPPKDPSVNTTPKKSWIDFITFDQATPEPVKQETPQKKEEEKKFDVQVTCEEETPLVGEEENPFVDEEEEEDHLNYEQQLNSRQDKEPESPINLEINEECEKKELNEELNVDVKSTNTSLVNECKDEFEEDRAMKTPDFAEESSNDQETQSDSDEEDIWSSINAKFKEIQHKQQDSSKNRKISPPPILDSLNSSFESSPPELKDEFMGEDDSDDENDIWGSIDKRAKSLFEKISDVKANQRRTDNHSNIERKSEVLSDKKSRQSRKLSTESSLGNPDSGKENADTDLKLSKKSEKVLSPVAKRRKIHNRKYYNEEYLNDEANIQMRNPKRNSIDSVKSDTNSSRGRSISTSTDEGSECDLKKLTGLDSDRGSSFKLNKTSLFNNSSKKIKIIDPIPMEPEAGLEKFSKHKKQRREESRRDSKDHKVSVKEKKAEISESTVKITSKPSKIFKSIDIFDKKYEKARKPSSNKKTKY